MRRTIDRNPTGRPLFCELTAFDKEGNEIARKRTVYSESYTDNELLSYMGVSSKAKVHLIKIRLLIEWIDNKPVRYDSE